ncbi:MAG: bacillithiol system redox-active protein YtxJ [Ferruginibacter sp.]
MNWISLETEKDLENIKERSSAKPQVIFKHSTRCSISSMVKSRLERAAAPEEIDFNILDLIANRLLSSKIAEYFSVGHESPQILIIKNGECVYDESHNGISMDDIEEQATK